MKHPLDENKYQPDLADELRDIGDRYGRLDKPEPPAMLDQAVLNSARRAVARKSRHPGLAWMPAFATVAVFGIAISLFYQQADDGFIAEPGVEFNGKLLPQEEQEAFSQQVEKMTEARESSATMKVETDRVQSDEAVPTTPESLRARKIGVANEASAVPSRSDFRSADTAKTAAAGNAERDSRQSQGAPPQPLSLAESVAPVAIELQDKDADATKRLAEILRLKEAGDEAWKEELEKFTRTYPDYDLPEALKTPGR
jgi:hypothetical protein